MQMFRGQLTTLRSGSTIPVLRRATNWGVDEMRSLERAISRRQFVAQGTATIGMMAAVPALASVLGSGKSSKVLHIIGHSHIDAAWLWPWRDGADSVLDTFRSALNRMNETPGFC